MVCNKVQCCGLFITRKNKKAPKSSGLVLRSQGSNLGPSGYEPDELPLLYFAIWVQIYAVIGLPPNLYTLATHKICYDKAKSSFSFHFPAHIH
jgi:hypothetical protein